MEEKKFNYKVIIVILLPVVLLMGVYLAFFNGKDTIGNNSYSSAGMDDADVVDTSRQSDKRSVYSSMADKERIRLQEEQMSNEDFFDNVDKKKSNYDALEEQSSKEAEPVKEEIEKPKKTYYNAGGGGGGAKREPLLDINKKQSTQSNPEPEVKRRSFYSASTKPSGSEEYSSTSNNNEEESEINPGTGKNYIDATIQQKSVIQSGQQVTIRTTEDCIIKGISIPKNTYMTGIATISSERVKILVSSINVNGQIIYTKIEVYDTDGNIGIYAPGGVDQDIAKQAAQGGGTKVSGTIPIIGTTISTGGSRKIQVNTASIPMGYKIILKEVKQL